ncbi:MAG: hypothetical protein ACLFUI_09775 [Halanaerobiales bacterium]
MELPVYKNNRDKSSDWIVIYGTISGVEGYALEELNKIIQKYLPYIVQMIKETNLVEDILRRNVLLVGTPDNNKILRGLIDKDFLDILVYSKESLYIEIMQNPYNHDNQLILLSGSDANGLLYAVRDFGHYIVDLFDRVSYPGGKPEDIRPFNYPFPLCKMIQSPTVMQRGL